ncbi:MAG: molybdopterin cofactor-binding domain-containing protein [Betaproteobacteria bacterium]
MTAAPETLEAPGASPRRRLLVATGIVGGALAIGVWRILRPRDRLAVPSELVPAGDEGILTAWLRIAGDGTITVQIPRQEMGQGITTALSMLVAEELDADFARVRFEQAPVAAVYANATIFGEATAFRPDDESAVARVMRHLQFRLGQTLGIQATGGSTGLRDGWAPMRQAGATARAMLLAAAAARLGVSVQECSTHLGAVLHEPSGKRLAYGDLAVEAAAQPIPEAIPLKAPGSFSLLGRSQPRLDMAAKVDGTARFGIDVRLPGLLYAAILQCPVFGGGLRSVDDSQVRGHAGVRAVVRIPATSTSAAAVAVVASGYWQAQEALRRLEIVWDEGPHAGHDTDEQRRRYEAAAVAGPARAYDAAGDPARGLADPARFLDATFFAPYLAHAAMEPINCTAVVRTDGSCELWVGNQAPTLVRWMAAQAAGIDSERVTVNTPFLGGGFGRRVESDVVVQAVAIAREMPGTPVQLIWSREEDLRHDCYRPMAVARFRAALDSTGRITAWHARIVGQSCTASLTARLLPRAASDLLKDRTTTEGAFDLPYALPDRLTEHVLTHEPVPVGYWRSVGYSYNTFFAECFLDECAAAAGQDPVSFRRTLLAAMPRHLKVLDMAAERSGWGAPLPSGWGRGIALAASFGSIVAQVAEVEIRDGRPLVHRVVCVIDCGFAVDPDSVVAQMEGSIIFALSAALHGEITVRRGRVEQSNFHDYRLLGPAEAPAIEVHILQSGLDHLGGVGEPGTPPTAPAVCNAVHAITGKRIRALPIRM